MNYYRGRGGPVVALLLGLWLWAGAVQAQVPAWVLATTGTPSLPFASSILLDMVPDASGNLLVTGAFSGQLQLGSFTLLSKGATDWFVAKYVPATGTWAWALRGGGTQDDTPGGLAVSGQNVYVVGTINNTLTDAAGVTFGGTSSGPGSVAQAGAGNVFPSYDLALLKLVDQGTTATVGWSQVAGGNGPDWGYDVAASGTSVYITGALANSTTNSQHVVFGGSGSVPGTSPQYGTSALGNNSDLVVAKYTDQGAAALFGWAQVGGSDGGDQGSSVAVSGGSVYVTGYVTAASNPSGYVYFGGSGTSLGTLALAGASATYSNDLVVAKYYDLGGSATVGWVQVAGGTGADQGQRVAVSGSQVYLTGQLTNNQSNANQVRFGGTGTTAGTYVQAGASPATSPDVLVAKYLDQGTTAAVAWTQVGGGSGDDKGYGLLVSNSRVYVSGTIENDATNSYGVLFGGAGTAPGTLAVPGMSARVGYDLVVASYLDAGTTAQPSWRQVGGGDVSDFGTQMVQVGPRLYVGGTTATPATYGSLTVATSPRTNTCLLAALDLSTVLAAAPPLAAISPRLYPNPAAGPATLSGAPAGTAVGIFDALGRRVATATADARGTAALPGGLAPGVYVVRAGTGTARWVVE